MTCDCGRCDLCMGTPEEGVPRWKGMIANACPDLFLAQDGELDWWWCTIGKKIFSRNYLKAEQGAAIPTHIKALAEKRGFIHEEKADPEFWSFTAPPDDVRM